MLNSSKRDTITFLKIENWISLEKGKKILENQILCLNLLC
jgi:hypothetical protein